MATSSGGDGAEGGGGGSDGAQAKPTGLAACCTSFFEYETPKVVTIQNVPLGILRLLLQLLVVAFVVVYQLYYARGYQEFAEVESSVTTKVKGFSRSRLTESAKRKLPAEWHYMYERVWDEADYVVPPAENGAFFVTTNVVLTPNQTRSFCAEDVFPLSTCKALTAHNGTNNSSSSTTRSTTTTTTTTTTFASDGGDNFTTLSSLALATTAATEPFGDCAEGHAEDLVKGHGTQTGNCIPSDRNDTVSVCEIESWCPVEIDDRPLSDDEGPLIKGVGEYTVFIKNSIAFPRFGEQYTRKNMNGGKICVYKEGDPPEKLCPIFKLGDIVRLANGNITELSVRGGVIGIEISWNCDLDWNFMKHCLPRYKFRILDATGWNFRHAFYHEENRRTLIKSYGLKFLLVIDGRAGKFDLKNTVIVLVTGLGLIGLSTMFCDFVLLNYSPERKKVKEKKYETVQTTSRMLQSTLRIISQTSNIGLGGASRQPPPAQPLPGDVVVVTNPTKPDLVGGGGGSIVRIRDGEQFQQRKPSSGPQGDRVAPAESTLLAPQTTDEVTRTPPSFSSASHSPLVLTNGTNGASIATVPANGTSSPPPPLPPADAASSSSDAAPVPPLRLPSPSSPSPPPPHYSSVAPQTFDTSDQRDSSFDPLLSLMEEEENSSIRFADETPR